MFFRRTKIVFLFFLLATLIFPCFSVLGETSYDLEKLCETGEWEQECNKLSEEECENLCNQCLDYLNQKGAKVQQEISETGQKKQTLQNQVTTLNKKIKDLDYQIYQSNISIKSLGFQIEDTEGSIVQTSQDIDGQKAKVAEILRAVQKEDKKDFLEIMISSDTVSQFFDNMIYLETLSVKNKEVLLNLQDLEDGLRTKKVSLEEETDELKNLVIIQGIKKEESAKTKEDREYYLGLTEKEYQAKLQEKEEIEKQAAEISKRIFELVGIKEGGIEFGEAVEIAKSVESITGVRAAFLLAIIHQESYNNGKFGGNVGQCYVTNFTTGAGTDLKGTAKQRVMSPKDIAIFLEITKELGMEAAKTPVSCWMPLYSKGVPYGWGGAMGPAQFIPSTWNLYRAKVSEITGRPANPWSVNDAFLAAGLLLRDNGAAQNEFRAAMRYFSGGSWTKQEEFYGRSVVSRANEYQKDIEILEQAKK
jgi:peptidoglycan hydrolase CwlO-like protein